MATSTTAIPPSLQSAIQQAAQEFGVPADVLYGQWQIESGASFPNPAVNSAGFGGLFGISQAQALANGFSLRDPNTTLQQARVAASDLANNIAANGGSIAQGLYHYSGGGYTSVPGQTTFGIITGVRSWPYVLGNAGNDIQTAVLGQTQGITAQDAQVSPGLQTQQQGQVGTDLSLPVNLGPWQGNISIPGTAFLTQGVERIFWFLVGVLCILVGLWLLVEGSKQRAQ